MPNRPNRPGRHYNAYAGSGGSFMRNLFGGEGAYELDEKSGQYKDKRGFMNKLYGASNTARDLNTEKDFFKLENDAETQRLREIRLLEEHLRQQKTDQEDADFGASYDAFQRTYNKGGQSLTNGSYSPMKAFESEQRMTPLEMPEVYSPASRGRIARNIYGNDPLVSSIAGGEAKLESGIGLRNSARRSESVAEETFGDTSATARNVAAAGRSKSGQELNIVESPEFKRALAMAMVEEILKRGDREVGPAGTIYGLRGRTFTGMVPEQQSFQTGGIVDPKTKQRIGGETKTITNYKPGIETPPTDDIEDFIQEKQSGGNSPYSTTDSPPSGLEDTRKEQGRRELERLIRSIVPRPSR